MIPLEEARAKVLASLPSPSVIRTDVADSSGLVLAEDVVSEVTVPPFDNSAMDGYAVRHSDLESIPVTLPVVEDLAAGYVASASVDRGTAIKIMTGAPIPTGADTIVRVEDTIPGQGMVEILERPAKGTSVRPAGGDVRVGESVFTAGEVITPRHIGVLAAIGVSSVDVFRPLTVAVMSTGDEVRPPDTADLLPGQIRDSNRPLLKGLLADLGVTVVDFGIIPDDRGQLTEAFSQAAAQFDAVITSGGVSMGEYDLVKQVLTSLGGIELWKVAMQPAKPFAYGAISGTPLFGLPGNPVSVFVAFEQFVRPAIRKMMGHTRLQRPVVRGVMDEAVSTDPEKTVFLRVSTEPIDGEYHARLAGGQSSNVLTAAARATGFAVVPRGTADVAAGETIDLEMFGWSQ